MQDFGGLRQLLGEDKAAFLLSQETGKVQESDGKCQILNHVLLVGFYNLFLVFMIMMLYFYCYKKMHNIIFSEYFMDKMCTSDYSMMMAKFDHTVKANYSQVLSCFYYFVSQR